MYFAFYNRLDSVSRLKMTYDSYSKSLTPYNFTIHRLSIVSSDKNIYKKVKNQIVNQLSNNDYLKELLRTDSIILNKRDTALLVQVQKTDSLVNVYLKIRINESQKEQTSGSSSTNLYMGSAESASGSLIVNELNVIQQRLKHENQRIEIDSIRAIRKNIINVLACFPESGYNINDWTDKKKFVLPIALVSLTLLVFSFIGLGKFLETESP